MIESPYLRHHKRIEKLILEAFAIGIETGVNNTLKELGLVSERVSEKQAYKAYGEKQVKKWRSNRIIVGYPSGNKVRSKIYFLRSELENARLSIGGLQNMLEPPKIQQIINEIRQKEE